MKLRSINKCLEMLKQDDPDTAVTLYLIRKLCQENKIYHIKSGMKYVSYTALKEYLEKAVA